MRINNLNQIFSRMEWIEEELEGYRNTNNRNDRSDFYYSNMLIIRDKQNKGIIPLEEYRNVGIFKSIEYEYYTANIHYDLFNYDINKKDLLEDRIIFFLNNVDRNILCDEKSWFRLNFIYNFNLYLKEVYNEDHHHELEYYINKYDNTREKEIYDIMNNICRSI